MKFYVTTAIDYINAKPHIGHAMEKVGADIGARYRRSCGQEVFFLIGTDEHSLNVQRQAAQQGITPRAYCDGMVTHWTDAWQALGISNDGFVRTTDPQHVAAVQELFRRIHAAGHLYAADYEGLYCASCENYYTEKDAPDSQCPLHRRPLERVKEQNLFFRLSAFQDELRRRIESGEFAIVPSIRRNEVLSLLKQGLQDISFTRTNIQWGIPSPVDSSQTIWIWFDALSNYISAIGYASNERQFARLWPADLHIIGKDITRFHCVIWPAMLLAGGVPLPRMVLAHGFLSVDGEKMSKTRGTMIEPTEVLARYPADVLRYYLAREVPFHGDGDFSWSKLEHRYNADLANDLGNLVNRTLAMITRYRGGQVPAGAVDAGPAVDLHAVAGRMVTAYHSHMEQFNHSAALEALWEFITRANRYVEESAPWKLAKDPSQAQRLDAVLGNLAEAVRLIGVLIAPVMPHTADQIRAQLGLAEKPGPLPEAAQWGRLPAGTQLGEIAPLFPRHVE